MGVQRRRGGGSGEKPHSVLVWACALLGLLLPRAGATPFECTLRRDLCDGEGTHSTTATGSDVHEREAGTAPLATGSDRLRLRDAPTQCCVSTVPVPDPSLDTCGGTRPVGLPFAGRSPVMAQHGMAATSQPLSTQAALDILKLGGSAVDAAIAANAMEGVVEPMMNGVGGDLMAMVWNNKEGAWTVQAVLELIFLPRFLPESISRLPSSLSIGSSCFQTSRMPRRATAHARPLRVHWLRAGKLTGYNGAGRAAMGTTLDEMRELVKDVGGDGTFMTTHGPLPVTVPGAAKGWCDLHARFGKLPLPTILAPAVGYARNGFPVTPVIASDWTLPPNNAEMTSGGKVPANWLTHHPFVACPRPAPSASVSAPHWKLSLQVEGACA